MDEFSKCLRYLLNLIAVLRNSARKSIKTFLTSTPTLF